KIMNTKRKITLLVALVLATAIVVFADYDLRRAGSRVYVDSVGEIRMQPVTGKGTTFASGTVKFTGATVTGLNGSAIDAGTISAARLPAAFNSLTFATGKTVALTDADSLSVGGVIVPQHISTTLCCLGASSASGDAVFVANRAYQVTAVRGVWSHIGGSGAAATIEKLTGTTAPGSGTAILTSAFDLTT